MRENRPYGSEGGGPQANAASLPVSAVCARESSKVAVPGGGGELETKGPTYLVAIFVAIGMFRAAGGIEMLTSALKPVLDLVDFPTELLPMCLVRPLSGSGTLGLFTELVKEFGPDSLLARTGGTILGSTETTLYVIGVYFGAVNVRRTRHAVPAGLIADAVGIIASVIICRMMIQMTFTPPQSPAALSHR